MVSRISLRILPYRRPIHKRVTSTWIMATTHKTPDRFFFFFFQITTQYVWIFRAIFLEILPHFGCIESTRPVRERGQGTREKPTKTTGSPHKKKYYKISLSPGVNSGRLSSSAEENSVPITILYCIVRQTAGERNKNPTTFILLFITRYYCPVSYRE